MCAAFGRLRLAPVVCATVAAGCAAPGYPELAALVSPGGTYVVRLSGRVTRAAFLEHRVRIEVYKDGLLHLPARLIYVAGLFDTPFNDRFRPPEWVAGNVLRFPATRAAAGPEPDRLRVRNTATRPFKSIRIETGRDMFMVLDLAEGSEIVIQMTPDISPWFDVLVDSGNPDTLMRGHGTFARPGERRGPRSFTVDVSTNGVQVAER
jgi:hypothetical protein